VAEFDNERLRGKSLEQLVEELGSLEAGEPHSVTWEMYRAAIDLKIAERVAAPRKWAMIATVFAGIQHRCGHRLGDCGFLEDRRRLTVLLRCAKTS
jgi:hypothetical protein